MNCKLFLKQENLGTILIGPFTVEGSGGREEEETSFV
jgi:hypothetical protein